MVVVKVETVDLRDLLQLSLEEVFGELLTRGKLNPPSHQELLSLADQASLVRRTLTIPVQMEKGLWRLDLEREVAVISPWWEKLQKLKGR